MPNTPTNGDDHLHTTAPNQRIDGLAGDDQISAGHNFAELLGGLGNDTLLSGFTVRSLADIFYQITTTQDGGDGDDVLTAVLNFENDLDVSGQMRATMSGGTGADVLALTLTGDGVDKQAELFGGEGNDRITASAGTTGGRPENVSLYASGALGDDVIRLDSDSRPQYGFPHSARLVGDGGGGNDRIAAVMYGESVSNCAAEVSLAGGDGLDVLSAQVTSWGDDQADALVALSGGAGVDRISANTLAFGAHITALARIDGGDGSDIIDSSIRVTDPQFEEFSQDGRVENRVSGGGGNDQITATIINSLREGPERNLVFGGDGEDSITVVGGDANRIEGNAGMDILRGGAGFDAIVGGAGLDMMWGGGGADRFVYASTTESTQAARDIIFDFTEGDRINLAGIDAGTAAGDQAFEFTGASGGGGDVWVVERGVDAVVIAETEAGARLVVRVADAADQVWAAGDFIL